MYGPTELIDDLTSIRDAEDPRAAAALILFRLADEGDPEARHILVKRGLTAPDFLPDDAA